MTCQKDLKCGRSNKATFSQFGNIKINPKLILAIKKITKTPELCKTGHIQLKISE